MKRSKAIKFIIAMVIIAVACIAGTSGYVVMAGKANISGTVREKTSLFAASEVKALSELKPDCIMVLVHFLFCTFICGIELCDNALFLSIRNNRKCSGRKDRRGTGQSGGKARQQERTANRHPMDSSLFVNRGGI